MFIRELSNNQSIFPLLSDADLERLYDQWEEDEEPLPVDELPDHDPRLKF